MACHLRGLDKTWLPFRRPDRLAADLRGVVELSRGFPLLADDHSADPATFECATGQEANPAVSARAKVYSVRRTGGEIASLHPVYRTSEDLVAERGGERGSVTP